MRITYAASAVGATLLLTSCSSTPKTTAVPASPPPQNVATQSPVVDAGVDVEAITVTATIDALDSAKRNITIRRLDGSLGVYRAGPEVVNFDQLRAGDEVVLTVTETCALFVVKGGGIPGVAGGQVVAHAPKGASPGGMLLSTLDYNATVMVIDNESRRVVLKYGPNDARSVKVGPGVDLTKLAMGDEVMVRATEAMAITVVKP